MKSEHDELVENILDIVTKATVEKLQDQEIILGTEEEYIENFLHVDNTELEEIIWFLTEQLPEEIYLDKNINIYEHFQSDLSKELIIFLHQEDSSSHYFKLILENFRDEVLYNLLNKTHLTET